MEKLNFKIIEKYLTNIFNHIEHSLAILDKNLNIQWCNKAYVERLGMIPEDILDKKCYSLWHKKITPCEDCPCIKSLITGNTEIKEKISPEGRHYVLIAIPLKEDGETKAIFEIGREITEKKILNETLRESIKLQGIYEIIDNFAHQFNNIFNGIYGFAQLLKHTTKDKDSLVFIEKLINSIERGSKFIKTLLSLKATLSVKKVFDLNFLILSFKEMLKDMASEKINMEFLISNEECLIKGDPMHLREVLYELVENAKNSILDRGVISISTEKIKIDSEEKVVLKISDTGKGMNEETLKRCFEPFFTNEPRRFGLGLTIVKHIIQEHKGFIEVESSPSKGTTIKIFFPSATLQQAQDT
ncbi:MAG: ATP-binding protein [Thermodesulfovibrio sp.]|nr:PAS domain-containing sensor histidine kinase [Thermodesulfovibrio sp.]MDW7999257.1 ATP-binding protein [Thermodesulfovibrio sp.]